MRTLRVFGACVFATLVAGVVTGLGARGAMYIIRLMNDSHNGEVTHANAAVGQVTLSGTMSIVSTVVFFTPITAVLYLLVRRFLPGRPVVKGLLFGVVLLALLFSGMIQDNEYEYTRYVSPVVGILLFVSLAPIYGVTTAVVAEGLGQGRRTPLANRWLRTGGRLLLAAVVVAGAVDAVHQVRTRF